MKFMEREENLSQKNKITVDLPQKYLFTPEESHFNRKNNLACFAPNVLIVLLSKCQLACGGTDRVTKQMLTEEQTLPWPL